MTEQKNYLKNLLLRAEVVGKKNWLQAINLLEKATDDYPRERAIYLTLGDIYARNKKFEQAISSYQQALTIDPKDEHLLFIIGNCYLSLSEYQMANAYYDQVSDETPELHYNQALAYAYSGQHEESLKHLKILLNTVKDNINIYYFLVEELLRLSKYDDAISWLNEVGKRFGVQRHQQILIGFVYSFRKIWLKSYVAFENADKMTNITNPDHLHSYATAAWQIGQLDKSADILNRAIAINPYQNIFHEDLIRLYIEQENFTAAKEALKRANDNSNHSNPVLLLLKDKITRLEAAKKEFPIPDTDD